MVYFVAFGILFLLGMFAGDPVSTVSYLVSIVFLVLGIKSVKATKKKNSGGTGSGSDGGYDGSTHTGTDLRGEFVTQSGRTVDTTGDNWNRDIGGNSISNPSTGERVGTDLYGNIYYTNDD